MTANARVNVGRGAAVLLAAGFIAAGGAIAYFWLPSRAGVPSHVEAQAADKPASGGPGGTVPASTRPGTSDAPWPDVTITLSDEAVERARIAVMPVAAGNSGARIRIPGLVQPNAYKQVIVTPLVGGRITRVNVQLGDRVRRGQVMADVYSPELADAQTQYLSFVAQLNAAHQELRRTERLVEIGAASRQELEKVRAEHASHDSHVEGARSRLVLLGMTESDIKNLSSAHEITATTSVPAPLDGVVTERTANPGLNVDPSTRLFTVVDLSTVWVVGDLYEKDFSHVRVGSPATVTTTAYPDLVLRGRVSYIDPQLNPETRTAHVRVEVGNPRAELRLGMFADVQIGNAGARVLVVPGSAIQNVGDRQVVYLVDPNERGRFIEREVRLGDASGEQLEVISGVQAGDVVVAQGSFFVRAERERLGLRPPGASSPPTAPRTGAATAPDRSKTAAAQTARVTVSEEGYQPSKVSLRAGVPARLTFVRTSDRTCGTEVIFPSLNLKRALPLNQPVTVEFTPAKSGEITFVCGMNMLRGTIVVE